jgi:hypothetical protein
MARYIVEAFLTVQEEHQKAVAAGNAKDAKAWAKLAAKYEKMMQQYRITIRYA